MSHLLRLRRFVAFSLLALVVPVISCGIVAKGVSVTVANNSGGDLTDVLVKFTGGTNSVKKLDSGNSYTSKVKPSSSSHLDIEFIDSSGGMHSEKIDVYFEPNYRGAIYVTVHPKGKVTFTNEITLR